MLAGTPQPASLQGVAEQRLHRRQSHQLGVGRSWGESDRRTPRSKLRAALQQVVDDDVSAVARVLMSLLTTLTYGTLTKLLKSAVAQPHSKHLRSRKRQGETVAPRGARRYRAPLPHGIII